jgi:hypothetical protein
MGIVRFARRFPHTFYVVAAVLPFRDVVSIRQMPADIFPEIDTAPSSIRAMGSCSLPCSTAG